MELDIVMGLHKILSFSTICFIILAVVSLTLGVFSKTQDKTRPLLDLSLVIVFMALLIYVADVILMLCCLKP